VLGDGTGRSCETGAAAGKLCNAREGKGVAKLFWLGSSSVREATQDVLHQRASELTRQDHVDRAFAFE